MGISRMLAQSTEFYRPRRALAIHKKVAPHQGSSYNRDMKYVVSVVALTIAVFACSDPQPGTSTSGGQSSSSGGSGSSSSGSSGGAQDSGKTQEQVLCDALASISMCPNGGAAPECTAERKCFYAKNMTEQATALYAACRANPSCKGDDGCIREAGLALGGAEASKYETDCAAKATACTGMLSDDLCTGGLYAYKGDKAAVAACLAKPCAEVESCIDSTELLKALTACKR
jgi:hypothetical protein